jgi:hypothetical protein
VVVRNIARARDPAFELMIESHPASARRLRDAGPKLLASIFKEIRIEALGLGKF